MRTQSDERLAALARAGSEAAFEAIVERYRRDLLRACRRVLPHARAEDAVQQAFMAAWTALGRGDAVANLRAWLVAIARNTALNALRSPGYDHAELQDSLRAGPAPQDELERREVMRQTLAGLAALPERQRDALLRSAVAGVAYADIARDLGLSEGAARQLVLRARSALRSAATAVVPWPLVQALALSGRGDAAPRIAELVAAGSGAGTSALLAKAGVVAVVAGGAAVAPVAVRHEAAGPPPASAASAADRPPVAARVISARQPVTARDTPPRASGAGSLARARHEAIDRRGRRDADEREDERGARRDDGGDGGRRSGSADRGEDARAGEERSSRDGDSAERRDDSGSSDTERSDAGSGDSSGVAVDGSGGEDSTSETRDASSSGEERSGGAEQTSGTDG